MSQTITEQGGFTSDGNSITLSFVSDIDWMRVYNLTEIAAQNDTGVKWFWQREFINAGISGLRYFKSGGTDNIELDTVAANEFKIIASASQLPLSAVAVVSVSNVAKPVITAASVAGLANGTIIRLSNILNLNVLSGFDFEINNINVGAGTFEMRYTLANAPGVGGGAGLYRVIPYDPIFYPRNRYIVNISRDAQAIVTLSVTHGYKIGQKISFVIPRKFGMTELNGVSATIVDVDTAANRITVDYNTTGFTAFNFIVMGDAPVTFAQTIPIGIDTASALINNVSTFSDARINTAIIGMQLLGGANAPGGANNDILTWIAGKSNNL